MLRRNQPRPNPTSEYQLCLPTPDPRDCQEGGLESGPLGRTRRGNAPRGGRARKRAANDTVDALPSTAPQGRARRKRDRSRRLRVIPPLHLVCRCRELPYFEAQYTLRSAISVTLPYRTTPSIGGGGVQDPAKSGSRAQ